MKNVIITGANSGIGKATALRLAYLNCHVTLICRNEESAKKTCENIIQKTKNRNVYYLIADLSIKKETIKVAHEYIKKYEKLDVLINNACNFDISIKKPKYTSEGIEEQLSTNVLAPLILIETLMSLLEKSSDGRIINISSKGLMLFPNIKINFENLESSISYNSSKTYYQNKLALLMISLYLRNVKKIKPAIYGISVTNVLIDTKKYNVSKLLKFAYSIKSLFSISPDEMSKVYVRLALGDKVQGFLYEKCNKNIIKEVKANKNAYDVTSQKKL